MAISGERIERVLQRVRPAVHGVRVAEITPEGVVRIALADYCDGCTMTPDALMAAIEKLILEEVPEVKGVERVPG
ncbi:MAG: NifU family protein [Chloroflexi bacterium]|nr:NifU family protein [Chloroflexota bacterium]